MAPSTKKISKPIFKTARPYTEPTWYAELRCPSKGKKRKRESKQSDKKKASSDDHLGESSNADIPPPPPEIGNHILIGLNTVTRHLEALAAQTAPPTAPGYQSAWSKSDTEDEHNEQHTPNEDDTGRKHGDEKQSQEQRPLSLVLITHNHPPASLPHAHIPTLIHLSILNSPTSKATRLIAVPPGCENRLSSVLHIPHVGALGILEGAPGADSLVAYVREHIDVTKCTWIDEAMKPEWKNVKIDTQKE
ncbi:RNase P and RNase MRP subunit [Kalmusia sp. IMI 367209]|nr:RNase P and RNase MRP subunit [Kalmusia sp. IMI 367209]